ncbi:MAG: hypothetical protein ABIT38_09280, partial [Gemmatimonadaceae bacterium]
TDLHQFVATTGTVTARRAVIGYEKRATSGNVDFGPSLTSPTFTAGVGGASPWIVRNTGTLSVGYVARASMYLRENLPDPRTMTLVATRGWLGGSNAYDVAVPDLAAATGFTAFWNFRRGASVKWTFTGGEGDAGGPYEVFCIQVGICPVKVVDGARYKSAQATGTVTVPYQIGSRVVVRRKCAPVATRWRAFLHLRPLRDAAERAQSADACHPHCRARLTMLT